MTNIEKDFSLFLLTFVELLGCYNNVVLLWNWKGNTYWLAFCFAVCDILDMQHPRVFAAHGTHDKNKKLMFYRNELQRIAFISARSLSLSLSPQTSPINR